MSVRGSAKNARKRAFRRRRGQALAELCAALLVIVPMFLLLLDCGSVFLGATLNDFICRDAARAAGSGPPSSFITGNQRTVGEKDAPMQRAEAVVKRVYLTGLPMKVRDKIDIVETVTDVPPEINGGAINGEISVHTTIDIYPPFLIGHLGVAQVTLNSKHVVPITYVRPAS